MPSSTGQRHVPPAVGTTRARLAALARNGARPERIEAARAELAEANARAAVEKIVSGWPPLSPEQRSKLALLLAPASTP